MISAVVGLDLPSSVHLTGRSAVSFCASVTFQGLFFNGLSKTVSVSVTLCFHDFASWTPGVEQPRATHLSLNSTGQCIRPSAEASGKNRTEIDAMLHLPCVWELGDKSRGGSLRDVQSPASLWSLLIIREHLYI